MDINTARAIFVLNLRRLMNDRRLNQVDIASALSTTPSTVSDWCLGKKYPRVDTMQRLADLFEVPMSSLTIPVTDISISEITESEKDLIKAYRAADSRAQSDALKILLDHPHG